MNSSFFFSVTKEIAFIGCTTLLLSMAVTTANSVLFPHPKHTAYVTVEEKKNATLYKKQTETWQSAKEKNDKNSFYFLSFLGFLFLFIGFLIKFNPFFLSLSFLLTGTFCLLFSGASFEMIKLITLIAGVFFVIFIGLNDSKQKKA